MTCLGEGFVREGLLDPRGLPDDQLDKQLNDLVLRFCRPDKDFDSALIFDHTDELLRTAKKLENEHNLESCCLFYMLWIEHQINLILRVMLRRINTSEEDAISIVRKLNIRDKLSWLWRLLNLETLPNQAVGYITTIEEYRNKFVHFKWQPFDGFEHEDRAWKAVLGIQEVIAALRAIEEKHVFYGQRHRLSEAAVRLIEAQTSSLDIIGS